MEQKKQNRKSNRVTIVILHGWKLSGNTYETLATNLRGQGFKVYAPDLPGFGSNTSKGKSLTMEDYIEFLKEFLLRYDIRKCVLVGHSFGGRVIVAALSEWKNNRGLSERVKGVILTGAPLIREPFSLRKKIGIQLSGLGKRTVSAMPFLETQKKVFRKFVYRVIGEKDYYMAGDLRDTFVNVIEFELESKLSGLLLPVLLVWGKNDRLVPFHLAQRMEEKIKNSMLIGIEKATHRLPYEDPNSFGKIISDFVESLP